MADAAGLAGLLLGGSTPKPPHTRIAKTARSTERSVAWNAEEDLTGFLGLAREKGAFLVALEITDRSQSLFDFQFPAGQLITHDQPVYLIAGNESAGVPQDILDLSHVSVHLPMFGQNTSMNVSVALGAAVYLLLQQLK